MRNSNPKLIRLPLTSNWKLRLFFGLIGLLYLTACSRKGETEAPAKILARIGSRTITVKEFIERAEYTIRPPYCRDNNYIHQKIVLNSLIAEKLLALETEKTQPFAKMPAVQAYLQGRKEQAMRQWMFYQEAYQQAKVAPADIQRVYRVAGRRYKVAFFSIPSDSLARVVQTQLEQEKLPFETVYQNAGGMGPIPFRYVRFDSVEIAPVQNALYADTLTVGQVIGPIAIDKNSHLVMQINGWTTRLAITENDVQQRWQDVAEHLKNLQATNLFEKRIAEIMQGKEIKFNRDTFFRLIPLLAPLYFKSDSMINENFNQVLWNKKSGDLPADSVGMAIEKLRDYPLFRIEGQVWSVGKLEKAIGSHPLVFRKRKFSKREFAEQFKLAVVDLVRDQYVTQAAYKKGYDQAPAVVQTAQMWQDNLLAMHQKYQYLKTKGLSESAASISLIEQHLNPYIDQLQQKYSPVIEIDTDEFEKIKLTRIDMFAMQQNVPFPVLVPGFPQLTTDNKLDYGRKSQK
ncbi:hypothetical protein L0128_11295 [candidate division KSB1 bacterium]|nr:hypothetical protein [candidate division KSB1 bacterium]